MALLIKFIAIPLYPIGLSVCLIIAGLIFLYAKKRIAPVLIISGCAVLIFFSSPPVANYLSNSIEFRCGRDSLSSNCCSAIVVLGGGGVPLTPPRKYPEINEAGDRIIHGARLYKMGIAKRVITTGTDIGRLDSIPSEAYENALLLREFGVDSSSIIIENKARNTHEHAPNIGKILDSLHLPRTIALVTSASHMPRSLAVFKKAGYKVYCAPIDYHSEEGLIHNVIDFFPSAGALELSNVIIHEYYGLIGYKLLGWI